MLTVSAVNIVAAAGAAKSIGTFDVQTLCLNECSLEWLSGFDDAFGGSKKEADDTSIFPPVQILAC